MKKSKSDTLKNAQERWAIRRSLFKSGIVRLVPELPARTPLQPATVRKHVEPAKGD